MSKTEPADRVQSLGFQSYWILNAMKCSEGPSLASVGGKDLPSDWSEGDKQNVF